MAGLRSQNGEVIPRCGDQCLPIWQRHALAKKDHGCTSTPMTRRSSSLRDARGFFVGDAEGDRGRSRGSGGQGLRACRTASRISGRDGWQTIDSIIRPRWIQDRSFDEGKAGAGPGMGAAPFAHPSGGLGYQRRENLKPWRGMMRTPPRNCASPRIAGH